MGRYGAAVPELLLGEDPPPPKRRSRWVDVMGLAAILGGMVAVGVLGDRGEREERAEPTPATSTTARAPEWVPNASTSSTARVPTTVPQAYSLGALTDRLTATTLLVRRASRSELLDVDTGEVIPVMGAEVGQPFPVRGGFVLAGRQLELLRVSGERVPVRELDGTWPVATTVATVWLQAGAQVVEETLEGRPTGRALPVPFGSYLAHVTDGGGVVGQAGSLTFVPFSGRPRTMGSGVPLAAEGEVLARISCEVLRCRLELVDLGDGTARRVEGIPDVGAEVGQAPMSPDGRWLVVQASTPDGTWHLVDVDAARANPVAGVWGPGPIALAAGGDYLFSVGFRELRVHDLRTGAWSTVEGIDVGDVHSIHATGTR